MDRTTKCSCHVGMTRGILGGDYNAIPAKITMAAQNKEEETFILPVPTKHGAV